MASGTTKIDRRVVKYRFGDFELLPTQGVLSLAGVRVPLMPKPLATLLVLVEHAGETVSKDDLLSQIWPDTAVEENNLTQSISTLRKVLGEKRGENRFIATEPGNGYRFVAAVTKIEDAPLSPQETVISFAPNGFSQHPSPARRPALLLALAGVTLLAVVAGVFLWARNSAGSIVAHKSVAVLGIRDLSKGSSEAWLQTALSEMLTSELGL
jgi:DNA-binding winged helix-turn-helix (wHTH) protein